MQEGFFNGRGAYTTYQVYNHYCLEHPPRQWLWSKQLWQEQLEESLEVLLVAYRHCQDYRHYGIDIDIDYMAFVERSDFEGMGYVAEMRDSENIGYVAEMRESEKG